MKTPQKRWLAVAMLFTLLAVGVHSYLSQQHYSLEFGNASASICNVNETFNCDAVSASKYSVFLGVPVAVLGACANLILLFLTFIAWIGWTEDQDAVARYAFYLGTLEVIASIVMGSVSAFFMHTYCLFCLTAYVLSVLQWICLWKGTEENKLAVAEDVQAMFTTRKWILVMFVLIPAGAFFANASEMQNNGYDQMQLLANQKVTDWKTAPETKFDMNRGLVWPEKVSPPKMTIVEFADFLCPHCKHASPSMNAFVQAHRDVRFVFKPFPLDGACNPALPPGSRGDGLRCTLAKIVICAEKLNHTGWAAHDYLFENQERFGMNGHTDEIMGMYCAEQKADCAAMRACVDSPETTDMIKAAAQEGTGIGGTPTVFVNGRKLEAGVLIPVLNEAYGSL